MEKKYLFRLTIAVTIITYILLFLIVENFHETRFYYQSMVLVGGIAFLINLIFGREDSADTNERKGFKSKSNKVIISFSIVIIIVLVWILGVVNL